jgi:hypothetical protein
LVLGPRPRIAGVALAVAVASVGHWRCACGCRSGRCLGRGAGLDVADASPS